MENVIKYVTGFFSGLMTVLMAVLPVTILWTVLTGGSVFGMDVIANLTAIVTSLGNGGFVGLIVLLMVASFFVKK
jgi:hypothetical protein|tara:strand:- start:1323 stop:1547 length:225 start_codon:yes stop_codon:yes gene_type:complete